MGPAMVRHAIGDDGQPTVGTVTPPHGYLVGLPQADTYTVPCFPPFTRSSRSEGAQNR